ncbi:hypothetical protein BLOT_013925 [Blomia tropicalis]|nr:hypothetical protein BLOT_013925 [Blomia tropicalis]
MPGIFEYGTWFQNDDGRMAQTCTMQFDGTTTARIITTHMEQTNKAINRHWNCLSSNYTC